MLDLRIDTASLSLLALASVILIPAGGLALKVMCKHRRLSPMLQRCLLSGYLGGWVGLAAWVFGLAPIAAFACAVAVFAAMQIILRGSNRTAA
jgi:hypothetical protein